MFYERCINYCVYGLVCVFELTAAKKKCAEKNANTVVLIGGYDR